MSHSRRLAIALVLVCAAGQWGCGPKRIRTPDAALSDLIVLLPDPENGVTGRAWVSNLGRIVELDSARQYTQVSTSQAPATVREFSEDEVRRLFGDVLAALPLAPQHFTLHFRFESDELTAESRALFTEIIQAVGKHAVPEVAVVGHTDTTGTPPRNFQLGLKRAQMIRNLLVAAGLNEGVIEITSHGEGDPLVATPDEALEPRNRRVEVTIR